MFFKHYNLITFFFTNPGKADFIGLNYYTAHFAEPLVIKGDEEVGYWSDVEVQSSVDPSWPQAKSAWLRSVPQGLRGMLKYITKS